MTSTIARGGGQRRGSQVQALQILNPNHRPIETLHRSWESFSLAVESLPIRAPISGVESPQLCPHAVEQVR
jgi:hypothetical protein